jgi:hypothetical protein
MFHWFQALLPKQGNFFALFEAHVATLTAGSDALARLLQGGAGMNQHIREIVEREESRQYHARRADHGTQDVPDAFRPQRDHQPDQFDGRFDRPDAADRRRGQPV